LVDRGLYSVVSLPSGVFQPYSGVKTSILLLDSEIAKNQDSILFLKISADGFELGAKKKVIESNDLPEALKVLNALKHGEKGGSPIGIYVSKGEIAEDGEYNLSADRYKVGVDYSNGKWPLVSLAELEEENELEFVRGQNLSKSEIDPEGKNLCIHYGELYSLYGPVIESVVSRTNSAGKILSVAGDVLVPATQTADALGMARGSCLNQDGVIIGGDINVIRTRNNRILGDYLAYAISSKPLKQTLANYAKGVNILHLSNKDLRRLALPIPPIEEQVRLIEEISKLQGLIETARKQISSLESEIEETVFKVWM
jgi:type I restriction enzyme M protein